MHYGADQRHVEIFGPAAQPVDHQLLGRDAHELRRVTDHGFAQFFYAIEFGAVHEDAGCVDRSAIVGCAPVSHGVEIFEREPDRVHDLVAAGTGFDGPVHLHLLADGGSDAAVYVGGEYRELRDVGRGRRRFRAEEHLQYGFAALYGGGSGRLRGDGFEVAFAEQAAAHVEFGSEGDATEGAAVDVGDFVMPGEAF